MAMSKAQSIEATKNIDLFDEIERLKRETNTVILAHYYQEEDIQDVADFIGDSLDLARKAQQATQDRILFSGVHFMAETAKILNPTKTVIIPDMDAGCSLADSCPPKDFKAFIDQYPDHLVVSYINCTAEIKAMSDIIVTSSNAVKIVNSIPKDQKIIFAPDKYLGAWVKKQSGRDDIILWQGTCIVHENFSHRRLIELKVKNPDAAIIAHPECPEELLNEAEFIGSTKKLLDYVSSNTAQKFIVLTEEGILYQMQKNEPNKIFIPALPNDESCNCNMCPYMKLNTLEKIYYCMTENEPQIHMSEDIRVQAEKSLLKMLELS